MRTSPSADDKWRHCEYKGFLDSVLRIEPRMLQRPAMDRGSLFHGLLEVALRRYAATGEVFAYEGVGGALVARDVFEDLYERRNIECTEEEAHELLDAIRWHIPRLGLEQWEILTVEVPGETPDAPRVTVPAIEVDLSYSFGAHELHAIVDLCFRHKVTGRVCHVNWKTSANDLKPRTHVRNDYQLLIERQVLRANGIAVDISALCYLRSLAPQPPALVHKGTKVSRDKSKVSCTWEMYQQVVRDIGGNVGDYEDMREACESKLFSRWCPDVTTPAAEEAMLGLLSVRLDRAEQIKQAWDPERGWARAEDEPQRKLGYGCNHCDHVSWCTAGLEHPSGHDFALLSADYRPRDDRSPLVQLRVPLADPFDRDARYRQFTAQQGNPREAHEEFKP